MQLLLKVPRSCESIEREISRWLARFCKRRRKDARVFLSTYKSFFLSHRVCLLVSQCTGWSGEAESSSRVARGRKKRATCFFERVAIPSLSLRSDRVSSRPLEENFVKPSVKPHRDLLLVGGDRRAGENRFISSTV